MKMKKVLNLSIILICVFILCGCNNKLALNENGKVTSQELISTIENVNNEYNMYYVKNKKRLSIELTYKNTNAEEVYNKFKNDTEKIINNKLLLNYNEIQQIDFIPLVDKQTLGCSNLYKLENNKFVLDSTNDTNIKSADNIKNGLDVLNNKAFSYEENTTTIENDNAINDSISVPQNGEFKPELLINDLNIGNTGLERSTFKVKNNGNKKIIVVDLFYEKDALVKGIVTKIQFLLERAFKDSGYDIDLCISQKHPMDLYRCKYVGGSWNK